MKKLITLTTIMFVLFSTFVIAECGNNICISGREISQIELIIDSASRLFVVTPSTTTTTGMVTESSAFNMLNQCQASDTGTKWQCDWTIPSWGTAHSPLYDGCKDCSQLVSCSLNTLPTTGTYMVHLFGWCYPSGSSSNPLWNDYGSFSVTSIPTGCTPSCAGKSCGDDGCGGVCGRCSTGYICNSNFQCSYQGGGGGTIGQYCVGSCNQYGATCGNYWNSCYNFMMNCGTCPSGQSCVNNEYGGSSCVTPTPPIQQICYSSWNCGDWTPCLNGIQTRNCLDDYGCSPANPPNENPTSQSCSSNNNDNTNTNTISGNTTITNSCIENWSCGTWSACVGGKHSKICNDLNKCGTFTRKPITAESCTASGAGYTTITSNGITSYKCNDGSIVADYNKCTTSTGNPILDFINWLNNWLIGFIQWILNGFK